VLSNLAEDPLAASTVIVSPPKDSRCELSATVAGDEVKVSWLLVDIDATVTDWIGLYPTHQPVNSKYVQSQYCGGFLNGEVVFKGVRPGNYEARFFCARAYEDISRSLPVRVGAAATLGIQLQDDQLVVQYALDPPSSTPTSDWVGLYEKVKRNKRYMTTAYGNSAASIAFKAPRAPGVYEVRLFLYGAGYNEQARMEFTIEDHDEIAVEQKEVVAGSSVNVNWRVFTIEPTTSDWVGLFQCSQTNNKYYLESKYTQGGSTGSFELTAPKEPGLYEVRFFAHAAGKYNTFRSSNQFAVVAPPPPNDSASQ